VVCPENNLKNFLLSRGNLKNFSLPKKGEERKTYCADKQPVIGANKSITQHDDIFYLTLNTGLIA